MKMLIALGLAACLLPLARPQAAEPVALPRVVLALYDARHGSVRDSVAHRLAEMPLNHLGLVVRYHDINAPLPKPEALNDVRGVLCWLEDSHPPKPDVWLKWADRMVSAGKKLVMMGGLCVAHDGQDAVPPARLSRLLERIGLGIADGWAQLSHEVGFPVRDSRMVDFERRIDTPPQPAHRVVPTAPNGQSWLVARQDGDPATDSHLVVTTAQGGYVADGAAYVSGRKDQELQWYVNPLEFFRQAFDTDPLPKPDTTTLAGRRMFYSHIDGDGWNNVSELPRYRSRGELSAAVILNEVIRKYPDLPVTVAPVGVDIDPARGGLAEARELARAILAEPNVEAATHTYTHPFIWGFYENYSVAREKPYLDAYQSLLGKLTRSYAARPDLMGAATQGGHQHGHDDGGSPRAYFDRPFDLAEEIVGSRDLIQSLLPAGKTVELMQWSGDTNPFEAALAMTKAAGMGNINGGDSRFDRDYPSLGWVAPLGRQVGAHWQIYASASNENTYTDLWTARFHGFRYLRSTARNTETPVRLKPLNVYYHMYSGEKQPALTAVQANLDYARQQRVIPVATSQYVRVVEGFYTTRIVPTGERSWRILDRGGLQTIRFDHASDRVVDYRRSSGVVGARHYQGSLYTFLDPAVAAPEVVLAEAGIVAAQPAVERPYLVESSWPLWEVAIEPGRVAFRLKGYGIPAMVWRVPPASRWRVDASGRTEVVDADAEGLLHFGLPAVAGNGAVHATLTQVSP